MTFGSRRVVLGALVELGQAAVGEGVVGVLLQGNVERPDGPIDVAHFRERQPQVNVRLRAVVQQANRLHVLVNGFFRALQPAVGDAQAVVGLGTVAIDGQAFLKVRSASAQRLRRRYTLPI